MGEGVDGRDEAEQRTLLLEMTPEQARVVERACDLASRIAMGQFAAVAEFLEERLVVRLGDDAAPADVAKASMGALRATMADASRLAGHPRGGSWGIGSPHVDADGRMAYELHKALARTLAVARDPHPEHHGVEYDGVTVRYAKGPAPVATFVAATGRKDP